jgi:hypothetical protein
MNKILTQMICGILLVSILVVSGCVAPPQETKSGGSLNSNNPDQIATATTSQSLKILTDVTPFQTQAEPTLGYNTLINPTPIPEDQVCLINFTTLNSTFQVEKFAKRFDLKNPPMYINYSINKPFNVTGKRIVTSKYSGVKDEVSYSYLSPYSYLEIAVRNPTTGDIYLQDGFGKKYGTSLNKTIQITKSGDLLIEISGFNVTPSIGIWVKPSENFGNDSINVSKMECHSQEYVKRLNQ